MTPYYEDGSVVIYHGDCRDVLPGLAGVACTVTSPPYNTLGSRIPTKGTGIMGKRIQGWLDSVQRDGYADDMGEAEYMAWQSDVADALGNATRAGGSFFYNHKVRYRNGRPVHPIDIIRSFDGWSLRQEIIWDRPGAFAFNARLFAPNDERVYWMVRDGADYHWNQLAASFLSVWRMVPPIEIEGHPCPYPIDLPQRCIAATTREHDVVVDPFMGSGTTLVAAKNLGRKAVGIEIEERFCELAARRCAQEVLPLGAA